MSVTVTANNTVVKAVLKSNIRQILTLLGYDYVLDIWGKNKI